MEEQVKRILADLGFSCQEKELLLSEVNPLPQELYVRERIDEHWVESLKEYIAEGVIEPFIVCARVEGLKGLHLIDTHHTYYALKGAGKDRVKALVVNEEVPAERIIIVQLRLNRSEQKPLTLKDRKQSVIKHYLRVKAKYGKEFYLKRGEVLREVAQETGLSKYYLYKLLEDLLKQEKEELKALVFELYSQGKSQYEIEEITGVPQQTVSYWINERKLNENNSQIITNPSTVFHDFSLKNKYLLIFTEDGRIDSKFLELLNGKLEEKVKVNEFLAEYEGKFEPEQLKTFKEWINRVVEEALLESRGDRDFFVYLIKDKLPLSERALKNLYEHAKALLFVVEKARKEFVSIVEELCYHDEAISEEAIIKLIKEKLQEKRTKGRFGEGNEYAIVSNFIFKHLGKFISLEAEKVKECIQKMSVLKEEDVAFDESFLELAKEEFEKELRARFYNYKIPRVVVEKVWEKVKQEKERREREKELAILRELLSKARDPQVKEVDEIAESEEELKVLKKHYHEIVKAFNSVKVATVDDLKDFQGETLEELKEWLLSNGYRVHNAEKLFDELKKKRRAYELLKEFNSYPYSSLEEFSQRLSEEDRLIFAKYSFLFLEELNRRPKATDADHLELARRMVEENLSEEQIRLEFWQKTGKIISPATLYKYAQKIKEELAQEQVIEIQEEEEGEKKKGITIRGVLSIARKLKEKVELAQAELKRGDLKTVEKLLEKIKEELEELEERAQFSLEKSNKLSFPSNKLVRILLSLNEFSKKRFGVPFIYSNDEIGRYMKLLDEALERYLQVSGYDFERDYQRILRSFLETYAYAYLRFKPTNELFLRKFISYRDDIRSGLSSFKDTTGKLISIKEISNWVESFLKDKESYSHAKGSSY